MKKQRDIFLFETAIIIVTQRSSYQLMKNIAAVPVQAAPMNQETDSSTSTPHTML